MLDAHKLAHDCIMESPPPCADACPLGVDVRDVIERAKIGSFSAAYKAFVKNAVFPGIVSHICPQPCREACVRARKDDAINLAELEKYYWSQAKESPPKMFYIPDKKKNILVIGGGISGMTISSKLAQRGYHVMLLERSGRLGGCLWELVSGGALPVDVLEDAILSLYAVKHLTISLNTEARVTGLADLSKNYDAVVVSTGQGGCVFNACEDKGGFLLGGVEDSSLGVLECIRSACDLSYIVENYIKIGRVVRPGDDLKRPKFTTDASKLEYMPSRLPMDHPIDGDDVQEEAKRCLLCACNNCVDACDMLRHYKKSPKKTIMDVSDTINKTSITKKTALRQIMSCTQCGRCSAVCPAGIDFKSVFLESRHMMDRLGQLPSGLYNYWLQDMEFSNSEEASVVVTAEGKARYLLFPGCQMGASDPEYVKRSWEWMLDTFRGEAALALGCCGAPAYWAGDVQAHEAALTRIRDIWQAAGKPTAVLPCATCMEMFLTHLPDIPSVSLWELMAGNMEKPASSTRKRAAVFDPCSSKYIPETQQAIRDILEARGYELTELNTAGRDSACCGYGGLIYTTNSRLYGEIRAAGVGMSELPYVVYCTNCRDNFAAEGKDVIHILDALFFEGEVRNRRAAPDLSSRRDNRRKLKHELQDKYLSGASDQRMGEITLEVSPELRSLLDRRLIVDDNIIEVIRLAESSGRKVKNKDTGLFAAHGISGSVTFWAVYEPLGNGVYRLHDAYAHRMVINEQEVAR